MRAPTTPARCVITVALAWVCGCDDSTLDEGPSFDCSIAGELALELGEGREAFEPFEDSPELFHGLQGGTHLILAARLRTPDPGDRYAISLLAEVGKLPCDTEDCAGWTRAGGFESELDGASGQLVETGPDELELTSLFIVVENWDVAPRQRLRLDVEDPCGRHASATRSFE